MALVAYGAYVTKKRDDAETHRAVKLVRALNSHCTARSARRITRSDPGLMMALKLHESGGLRRLEIQCRILARQSDKEIVRIMGLTLGMTAAYRAFFSAWTTGSMPRATSFTK